jgi:heme/copper-type cytochrome/quinol oxidase subunit 2
MNNKVILLVLGVVLIGSVGGYVYQSSLTNPMDGEENKGTETLKEKVVAVPHASDSIVKEFVMTSFVKAVDGKYFPQYSLKEITVNKGDKVRIKITVTSGMHDFKIDEYNIFADTELNKEYVVEFTADKAGEFVYYCTKPGHREKGQWGTLKVLDK